MATRYVLLNTKTAAKAQSADWWTKVLTRAKSPTDITTFLAMVLVHPVNGTALIVVSDEVYALVTPKLTAQEKTTLDASLLPATDPVVVAFLAASPTIG